MGISNFSQGVNVGQVMTRDTQLTRAKKIYGGVNNMQPISFDTYLPPVATKAASYFNWPPSEV